MDERLADRGVLFSRDILEEICPDTRGSAPRRNGMSTLPSVWALRSADFAAEASATASRFFGGEPNERDDEVTPRLVATDAVEDDA